MARIDLLANEDFKAYQEDLIRRREKQYEALDSLLNQREFSPEWTNRLLEVRASIRELNVIIGVPEEYRHMAASALGASGDEGGADAQEDMARRIRNANWKVRLHSLMRTINGASA